jgi:hypothetical protein
LREQGTADKNVLSYMSSPIAPSGIIDSSSDSSSNVSTTHHSPTTQKNTSHTFYKLRTTTKQKAQQSNIDDISPLEYSSSSPSQQTNKHLKPSSTIFPTTNVQNRKVKPTKRTSTWQKIFSSD